MTSDSNCLRSVSALRITKSTSQDSLRNEALAEEKPLNIIVKNHGSLGITLCSPQNLEDLVIGFLFTSGIIDQINDIEKIKWQSNGNCEVSLKSTSDLPSSSQNLLSHSACGTCRFESLEGLPTSQTFWNLPPIPKYKFFDWFDKLHNSQPKFRLSGGLHASALFSPKIGLINIREDIGRHNSLDKLIGSLLKQEERYRFSDTVLLLSGRAGFELLQKAARSGISIVAAIGAPSFLALELARKFGITLIGFLREERFNVYSHANRIEGSEYEIKDA